ncbi:class I SAM-dependent methyltransferase [Mycolicibacterium helvum]|uniref:Methyltransferase n=1 Tax=Mycolicibacterium helvum TaxID=1534349 RepID=A0A7I7TAY5_9MYCO|nr:class I SAM-dependent methyltransferase [Mycolicibacterium helvum]BBY66394.1 methyltransferase [Mycolicibacterium helvum]
MTPRLPDEYFAALYEASTDPWQLESRWYERRKYAITLALLPEERYQHAFEPGCSVGVLTEQLSARCDHVTAIDVAEGALAHADARLRRCGRRETVTLLHRAFDMPWPAIDFDLVMISEVAYYFDAPTLRAILDRELPRLHAGVTVIAAHWRHPVADYPLSGDEANAVIGATAGLHRIAEYRDDDVAIAVFDTRSAQSVAARTAVPGA